MERLYWKLFLSFALTNTSTTPSRIYIYVSQKKMCIPFALFREFFFLPSFFILAFTFFFGCAFFHINFHFLLLHFFFSSLFCNAFTADFFFFLFFSCIVGVCRKNYKLQTHTTDDFFIFFFVDGGCWIFLINKILFFCFSSFRQPARDFIADIIITAVDKISVIVWNC